MDGLRSQLAEVRETLRDVVGRLDALERNAVTAEVKLAALVETKPPLNVETKQPMNVAGKPPVGTGGVVTRKS